MSIVKKDINQIAYCGLYCWGCKKFLANNCPGCRENSKATWCEIRSCCKQNNYLSCADCTEFKKASDCKKFNNFISKIFKIILKSNRQACIDMIKSNWYESFADYMTQNSQHTIKK